MKDINQALARVYFAALTGITYNATPVPVYNSVLPDDQNPNNYIIFGEVTSVDSSTKGSAETISLMRVTIHTFEGKYNNPTAANNIAGQVYEAIYPNTQANLDLSADGLQMVSTEMASDNTQNYSIDNSRAYIDRIIIFRHKIFHG